MSQSVEQAEAALEAAKAAYQDEMERDAERGEGSAAQERRRVEHQQSLLDNITQCERDLEAAKRAATNQSSFDPEKIKKSRVGSVMKMAVAAIGLMAMASSAFADDAIFIPSLATLPIIVTASGARTSGYIKNFVGQGKGGKFNMPDDRIMGQLQEHQCAIHFGVIRDAKSGRIVPKNGIGTIACQQLGGTVVAIDVPGALIDSTGIIGLNRSNAGEKAFFMVQSNVRIPVGQE